MSSNSDNLTDDEMLFMHNQISCNWCGVTPDEPKGFAYWACDKGGRGDSHEKEYFCMDCTKEIKIMHDGERVCPTCSFYDEFPWRDTPPLNPINMDLIEFFKQPNEDGTYDAETKKRKLSKTSCCCGATKAHPCLCMIQGNMKCAAKSPMCPCYKEIAMGIKVEMEHTKSKEKAEKIAKEHLAEHPDYYSRLKKAGLGAETFEADSKSYYEVMVDSSRLDNLNADFDGLTMELQDSLGGYVFSLDYGEGGDEPPMTPSEAKEDYMNQIGITTYSYERDWDEDTEEWVGAENTNIWRGTINFPEGKQGEGGEFYARVFGFKDGESQTEAEEKIMSHVIDNVHVYVRERDEEDGMYYPVDGYYAETFEASQRKCGACGETGHNARTCKSKIVPFSTGGYWNEKTFDGLEQLGLPLVDSSHVAMISKIVDGEVLKEPNARVQIPRITWNEEPIKMTWGELDEKCKKQDLVSIGESTYSGSYLRGALAYLPKNTVLTLYTGYHYPLKATFEYGGEEWIFFLAPRVESMYAETFDAAVVARSVPKSPVKKAMLNKAMMDKAEIEEAILDLETRVRLGLISEDEVMRKLHHRFGSEEEFVSCPHCEGSGSIADPSTYLPATREDPAEVDSMECPYCEGSGEVPEDEADEIPAYDWDYYSPNPDDRWDNYDRHEGRYDSESPKGIRDLRAGDKNLAGANLAGANLSGANLIDTNLENAILSNANLKSANLSGANLKGARIDFANLNSANLSGANLENVYANRATFRKANFKGANLDKVNFRQADLRGANLEDVKLNFSYQFHSFGGAELIDVIGLTDENKKLIAQDKGIFSEKDWDDYYGNHAEEEGSKAFMVAGITILSALSFGIYKRWKS